MITKKEQISIKKTLGNHYSKKVLIELKRLGIFNTKGEVFLAENIRKIVNRNWEHEEIETAILKLVKRTNVRKKNQAERRKKLISSK
jgi:hypothetical protein